MAPRVFLQKVIIRGGYAEDRLKFFNKTYKNERVEIVSCIDTNDCKLVVMLRLKDPGANTKAIVELRIRDEGKKQKKTRKDDYDEYYDEEEEEEDEDDDDEDDYWDDDESSSSSEDKPPKTKSPSFSDVLTKDTSRGE